VDERRVHDDAAPPRAPHREREVAVVAVEEAVRLVEAADRREQRARECQAHAIDGRHLHDGREQSLAVERVDDGAADVAAVAAHAARAVESRQADVSGERLAQPLQPARIAGLGVVVEEAEHFPGRQARALVERADEADVRVVAVVPDPALTVAPGDVGGGLVGGGVVHHAQLEGKRGRRQALETRARQSHAVVDHQDHADGHGPTADPGAAARPVRRQIAVGCVATASDRGRGRPVAQPRCRTLTW
jgi:hypothetical protein